MKITVTSINDIIFVLDVDNDMTLENFIALCAMNSNIPADEIMILYNNIPLTNRQASLRQHSIQDEDVVFLQHVRESNISEVNSSSKGITLIYQKFKLLIEIRNTRFPSL